MQSENHNRNNYNRNTLPLFSDEKVNLAILRERAFNYRWATLEKDVIPLSAADPDFPVAEEITKAIHDYSHDGYFSYGPPEGLSDFKKAISLWHYKHKSTLCPANQILPVNSAAQALYLVAQHLLQPGEEAIIPDPVDFLFRKSIENAGGKAITCPLDSQTAAWDLNQLESLIGPKTKAIFICNPSNPLGKVISKEQLRGLGALACKHNLAIVSDEIWSDIVYAPATFHSIAALDSELARRTFVISGLSKNFGLAGLRIGYIMAPDPKSYQELFQLSRHPSTANGLSTISQIAGTAALNQSKDWLDSFVKHLTEMRGLVLENLKDSPLFELPHPNSTYLAFPRLKTPYANSIHVVEHLHKEARVALIPGSKNFFENASEGHVRICYATSKSILTEAFQRINHYCSKEENMEQLLSVAVAPSHPIAAPHSSGEKPEKEIANKVPNIEDKTQEEKGKAQPPIDSLKRSKEVLSETQTNESVAELSASTSVVSQNIQAPVYQPTEEFLDEPSKDFETLHNDEPGPKTFGAKNLLALIPLFLIALLFLFVSKKMDKEPIEKNVVATSSVQEGEKSNSNHFEEQAHLETNSTEALVAEFGNSVFSVKQENLPEGFYAIIGSVSNKTKAQKEIQKLKERGYNGFVFSNKKTNRIAIALSHISSKEESQIVKNELNEIQKTINQDAWLMANVY